MSALRTLPPLDFCTVIVQKIILSKSTIPTRLIYDEKNLLCQEGISPIIL